MAGEIASITELKSWYDKFNSVINNYGGGVINTVQAPSSGSKITSSNLNNLYNTINAFKTDEYLKTQPQLYSNDYSIISSGTKIVRSSQAQPIITTVQGIQQIRCRNNARYSNTSNGNATNSNSSNSNGANDHVARSHESNSNGTNSNTNKSNGSCENETRSVTCDYQQKSNGGRTHAYYRNDTCDWDTHTNGNNSNEANGHVAHTNTAKSNTNNSNTNKSYGTCSHGTCSHGTCSHGTKIDILNANVSTTK